MEGRCSCLWPMPSPISSHLAYTRGKVSWSLLRRGEMNPPCLPSRVSILRLSHQCHPLIGSASLKASASVDSAPKILRCNRPGMTEFAFVLTVFSVVMSVKRKILSPLTLRKPRRDSSQDPENGAAICWLFKHLEVRTMVWPC